MLTPTWLLPAAVDISTTTLTSEVAWATCQWIPTAPLPAGVAVTSITRLRTELRPKSQRANERSKVYEWTANRKKLFWFVYHSAPTTVVRLYIKTSHRVSRTGSTWDIYICVNNRSALIRPILVHNSRKHEWLVLTENPAAALITGVCFLSPTTTQEQLSLFSSDLTPRIRTACIVPCD